MRGEIKGIKWHTKKEVEGLFLVVLREHGAGGSPSGAQRSDTGLLPHLRLCGGPPWVLGSAWSTWQEMMDVFEPREEDFLGLTGDISCFREWESSMCGSPHLGICHGKAKKNKSQASQDRHVSVVWLMTGPSLNSERPWKHGRLLDQLWSLGLREQKPLTQFSTGKPFSPYSQSLCFGWNWLYPYLQGVGVVLGQATLSITFLWPGDRFRNGHVTLSEPERYKENLFILILTLLKYNLHTIKFTLWRV